jgi:hypothetical protein
MKIISLVLVGLFLMAGITLADDGITLKQGVIKPWKVDNVYNMTTVTVIRGKPMESFPTWLNACIDGTIVDAGWAYDMSTLNSGAIMVGREFGTLGKYVKFLDFPLMNKVNISIYYAGLYAEDLFHELKTQGASGAGYFQAEVKF